MLAGAWAGAQNQLDFNNPAIPEVAQIQQGSELVSGHSVSLSLIGLDYSYEHAFGGNWSLVGRAAAPVYGIRRAGNHWYREYTFGLTLNTIAFKTPYPVWPHLGFRIGYTF